MACSPEKWFQAARSAEFVLILCTTAGAALVWRRTRRLIDSIAEGPAQVAFLALRTRLRWHFWLVLVNCQAVLLLEVENILYIVNVRRFGTCTLLRSAAGDSLLKMVLSVLDFYLPSLLLLLLLNHEARQERLVANGSRQLLGKVSAGLGMRAEIELH